MERYSAKLLFQFRVVENGNARKRRTCEERIVHFRADSAKHAVRIAKAKGQAAQYDFRNAAGNPVVFEFVGVMDLRHLGIECEEDEVWYDIRERLLPMERKNLLIPDERELSAVSEERNP